METIACYAIEAASFFATDAFVNQVLRVSHPMCPLKTIRKLAIKGKYINDTISRLPMVMQSLLIGNVSKLYIRQGLLQAQFTATTLDMMASRMTKLTHIKLSDFSFDRAFGEALLQMPNLTKLNVRQTREVDNGVVYYITNEPNRLTKLMLPLAEVYDHSFSDILAYKTSIIRLGINMQEYITLPPLLRSLDIYKWNANQFDDPHAAMIGILDKLSSALANLTTLRMALPTRVTNRTKMAPKLQLPIYIKTLDPILLSALSTLKHIQFIDIYVESTSSFIKDNGNEFLPFKLTLVGISFKSLPDRRYDVVSLQRISPSFHRLSPCDYPAQTFNELLNITNDPTLNITSSLTIQLADGEYSGVNNTNFNIAGYNLTITTAPGQQKATIGNGLHPSNITPFMYLEDNSPGANATTSVTIANILFNGLNYTMGGSLFNVVSNSSFTLAITGCEVTGCTSAGGLVSFFIYSTDQGATPPASIDIGNSTFNSNIGGIVGYLGNVTLTIDHCVFFGNSVENQGSVVVGNHGSVTITNSDFHGNIANLGALYMYRTPLSLYNTTFFHNTNTNGGAVMFIGLDSPANLTIIDSVFVGNTASNGAAIYALNSVSPLFIQSCSFSNNVALVSGGSIYFEGINEFGVYDSVFGQDISASGASICLNNTAGSLNNITVDNNSDKSILEGGAIFVLGTTLHLNLTTLTNNTAGNGGSIFCDKSTLILNNCTFANNTDRTYIRGEVDNIFCDTVASGVIVGIVIGCVLGSFLIVLLVLLVVKKRGAAVSLISGSICRVLLSNVLSTFPSTSLRSLDILEYPLDWGKVEDIAKLDLLPEQYDLAL
eukprot:gene3784-4363_t